MKLVEPLSWDTSFFELAIGRVRDGVDAQTVADAVAEADAGALDCLYLLADAGDAALIDGAQRLGFRVRDTRLELEKPLARGAAAARGEVRRAAAGDLPRLQTLARERVRGTRFFADPRFARERCTELYAAWLARGVHGAPRRVTLMSDDASGFVVCHTDAAAGTGTIELIAVSADVAGRGVAARLLDSADALFAQAALGRAAVSTQCANIAAQRLYQRHGYRTAAAHVWLHRWSAPDAPPRSRRTYAAAGTAVLTPK